jgi:L-fuculose-phosphate aldolase
MKINQSLQGDLETLARACRVLDMEGQSDLTQGHLSMRDPDGRGVWMKKRGISLRQVRSLDDMVLISWEGELLEGNRPMHLEWPIHTEIMLVRPEINSVGHTHAYHASIFSATNETLRAVVQGSARILGGRVARYAI